MRPGWTDTTRADWGVTTPMRWEHAAFGASIWCFPPAGLDRAQDGHDEWLATQGQRYHVHRPGESRWFQEVKDNATLERVMAWCENHRQPIQLTDSASWVP